MKRCPYCAEQIQEKAIKCRFCGEYLKRRRWLNCFTGCLVACVASILLVFFLIYFGFAIFKLIFYRIFFPAPDLQPYSRIPFTGYGIEGILREFGQIFTALWERLADFFYFGSQRYTF